MTRHLERHGHFRETSFCLGGEGGGIQLIWRHFVLQAAGRSRHLLSATRFVSGRTLQGPQGGHTPIVLHAAVTLCPAACPCKQRQGSSRLTSARGANGALSFSCPCSCVHRAERPPCDTGRACTRADSRNCHRQVSGGLGTGAHRNGRVARVVEAELPHRLTCRHSLLHPYRPHRLHLLKINLDESPRRTNLDAAAGLAVKQQGRT